MTVHSRQAEVERHEAELVRQEPADRLLSRSDGLDVRDPRGGAKRLDDPQPLVGRVLDDQDPHAATFGTPRRSTGGRE